MNTQKALLLIATLALVGCFENGMEAASELPLTPPVTQPPAQDDDNGGDVGGSDDEEDNTPNPPVGGGGDGGGTGDGGSGDDQGGGTTPPVPRVARVTGFDDDSIADNQIVIRGENLDLVTSVGLMGLVQGEQFTAVFESQTTTEISVRVVRGNDSHQGVVQLSVMAQGVDLTRNKILTNSDQTVQVASFPVSRGYQICAVHFDSTISCLGGMGALSQFQGSRSWGAIYEDWINKSSAKITSGLDSTKTILDGSWPKDLVRVDTTPTLYRIRDAHGNAQHGFQDVIILGGVLCGLKLDSSLHCMDTNAIYGSEFNYYLPSVGYRKMVYPSPEFNKANFDAIMSLRPVLDGAGGFPVRLKSMSAPLVDRPDFLPTGLKYESSSFRNKNIICGFDLEVANQYVCVSFTHSSEHFVGNPTNDLNLPTYKIRRFDGVSPSFAQYSMKNEIPHYRQGGVTKILLPRYHEYHNDDLSEIDMYVSEHTLAAPEAIDGVFASRGQVVVIANSRKSIYVCKNLLGTFAYGATLPTLDCSGLVLNLQANEGKVVSIRSRSTLVVEHGGLGSYCALITNNVNLFIRCFGDQLIAGTEDLDTNLEIRPSFHSKLAFVGSDSAQGIEGMQATNAWDVGVALFVENQKLVLKQWGITAISDEMNKFSHCGGVIKASLDVFKACLRPMTNILEIPTTDYFSNGQLIRDVSDLEIPAHVALKPRTIPVSHQDTKPQF